MMLLGSDYLQQEEPIRRSTPITQLKVPVALQKHTTAVAVQPTRRREMLKLVTYALVILFALAVYTTMEMVIKETVASSDLGYKQELGIRVLYPLLLFLALWNIKVFMQ